MINVTKVMQGEKLNVVSLEPCLNNAKKDMFLVEGIRNREGFLACRRIVVYESTLMMGSEFSRILYNEADSGVLRLQGSSYCQHLMKCLPN